MQKDPQNFVNFTKCYGKPHRSLSVYLVKALLKYVARSGILH